jgi:diguanylate cyclase (GGDEF)-like protein/PAS domain S-box-containing protein
MSRWLGRAKELAADARDAFVAVFFPPLVNESPRAGNSKNPSTAQAPAIDPAALQSAVLREQVRILYESPAVVVVNLLIAVLLAYLLRKFYPGWLVVAWAGLLVVVSTRLYDFWRYRRNPQPAETAASWAMRFTVGATATGCLGGLIGSVMLLTSDSTNLAFIAFVVGGLTAFAAVGYSSYPPAMIGFTSPVALTTIPILLSRATVMSIAMELVATAGIMALRWLSDRNNRWITSTARREMIQADLAANLKNQSELLHAVSLAAKELLTASPIEDRMATVLKAIGLAVRADRVIALEIRQRESAAPYSILRYSWQSPAAPAMSPLETMDPSAFEADPCFAPLFEGKVVACVPSAMTDGVVKTALQKLGIASSLDVPIIIDGKYWGRICFDDCTTEREWTSVEVGILRTLADLIGGAIIRERYIEQLRDANTIVESSPTILFRLRGDPSLPLTFVSRNVTAFGYSPAQMIASPQLYQTIIHPDDTLRILELMARLGKEGGAPAAVEFRMRASDGLYRWLECHYTPIRDAAGRLVEIEGILTDITEKKEAAEKIMCLARTDALTGLANRATFIDRLRQTFAAAKRGANRFAILYLDLDRFKDINDTLGHVAGDLLLQSVAERLKGCTRETDLVARLGGDEFAILQSNLVDLADAGVLASKIHKALAAPYPGADTEMRITVSIGISPYTPETAGPDEMLAQADLALYRAKDEGRNQYCFHTDDLDREVRDRVGLSSDLTQALEGDELELYFQPQVELATGLIVGMEALIRWNHPKRSLIMPRDFLPVVEKSPLIVTLGQWVLDHACEQMNAWRNAGVAPPILAVNLSLGQLRTGDEFVGFVTRTLTKWGLSPQDIELDVTESMLAHVTLHKNSVLDRLQRLGVKIAIDDFGAQYSSLDYLRTYRVSRVKIPRQLIDAAPLDPEASAMVRAIIGVARELDIDVIAQGVQTEAQRELLNCAPSTTKVQGFYYSAPVPAVQATELLRQRLIEPRLSQGSGAGCGAVANEVIRWR